MQSDESDRIRGVYHLRDAAGMRQLYAWHRPEILLQNSEYERELAPLLNAVFGGEMHSLRALDVGCGRGKFLRRLIEWGCKPQNLVGTELLNDRIEEAKQVSPLGITWHLGGLRSLSANEFDLVAAHTVFSSILHHQDRRSLASEMIRKARSGGWILVFDFRYNNPRNPNVRRVERRELEDYFAPVRTINRTIHLAPPLARRIAPLSPRLCDLLSLLVPFLRSHFILLMQKA